MERDDLARALIAIVLSFVILIAYQYYFAKPAPREADQGKVVEKAQIESGSQKAGTAKEDGIPSELPPEESPWKVTPVTGRTVKVDTPLYAAELSSDGAIIKKWVLKKYGDEQDLPVMLTKKNVDIPPLSIARKDDFDKPFREFSVTGGDLTLNEKNPSGTISFVYNDGESAVKRTLTFYADTYRVDVTEETRGTGNYWVTLGEDFGLTGAAGFYSHIGPVTLIGTDRDEFKPEKIKEPQYMQPVDLKWIALEDKYFFSSLVPLSDVSDIKVWRRQNSGFIAIKVAEGKNDYVLYAGPKVIRELEQFKLGLEHIVDFGFWSFIARPLFWLLMYINGIMGNYGWSIIILTIVVRIPFIPLLNKGQKSMKKMQSLQPKMQEIKEKYKKDPQKMQKEMMGMYKKHKVNPMGGCLPMLVQIPVFFALYKVLLVAIEMRHAPWILWVQDLSAKDPFYVLPIVMGATMFLQQKMTPTSADPRQAKIMMFMPIIFTFMFLNFSSGLVLYWLISNVLSIIQQFFVNKKVAAEEARSS